MTSVSQRTLAPLLLVTMALWVPTVAGCKSVGNGEVAGTNGTSTVPPATVALRLEEALPIEFDGDFEPSGLLLLDGHLLTVSDKHNDTVFELLPGKESAKAKPFVQFSVPPPEQPPFDFEGISLDSNGSLLLASEATSRVLCVNRKGEASWATPSLQPLGTARGLLSKHNAGFEGITRLPNGSLLLAAERESRGLIEFPATGDFSQALVFPMLHPRYPGPPERQPDFSDLTVADGNVYVLERYAHLVVRLERTPNEWLEREAWSYASIENDPRFAYANTRYGLAEGLAIDGSRVYLTLDNNRDRRAADLRDHRALLLVLRRP